MVVPTGSSCRDQGGARQRTSWGHEYHVVTELLHVAIWHAPLLLNDESELRKCKFQITHSGGLGTSSPECARLHTTVNDSGHAVARA